MSETVSQQTQAAIAQALLDAASSPASASNDTGSVASRPIADIILLDRHVSAKAAMKAPNFGLIIAPIAFPGTV